MGPWWYLAFILYFINSFSLQTFKKDYLISFSFRWHYVMPFSTSFLQRNNQKRMWASTTKSIHLLVFSFYLQYIFSIPHYTCISHCITLQIMKFHFFFLNLLQSGFVLQLLYICSCQGSQSWLSSDFSHNYISILSYLLLFIQACQMWNN